MNAVEELAPLAGVARACEACAVPRASYYRCQRPMGYSDIAFSVALSNHADFVGTLEYIKATKTKYVVTDNTRGHAAELAMAVTTRLGIPARPSTPTYPREWGLS